MGAVYERVSGRLLRSVPHHRSWRSCVRMGVMCGSEGLMRGHDGGSMGWWCRASDDRSDFLLYNGGRDVRSFSANIMQSLFHHSAHNRSVTAVVHSRYQTTVPSEELVLRKVT